MFNLYRSGQSQFLQKLHSPSIWGCSVLNHSHICWKCKSNKESNLPNSNTHWTNAWERERERQRDRDREREREREREHQWNLTQPYKTMTAWVLRRSVIRVQELCESRGGRPGLSVLTSLMVTVDLKQHWTMLWHWSQFVPDMSTDFRGHEALLHLQTQWSLNCMSWLKAKLWVFLWQNTLLCMHHQVEILHFFREVKGWPQKWKRLHPWV